MPYIIGGIAVVLFLALIALCTKKNIKNNIYICSKCKKRFYPRRKHSYLGNMSNDSEILKCPNCKKISICSLSHDQNAL